jgi:hypothetical protein
MNAGDYSGLPIILLGLALFLLNTYDGIRQSLRFLQSNVSRLAFSVLYILFAVRLIEVAWKFTLSM